MKRDSLLYRYFKELPGCFFHLIGRPEAHAARFELNAIEYKETAVRLDGVFQPLQPDADPAYLWEAQFYASNKVYANVMSKIGRFLEHGDPNQDWVAVVIYPNRSLEQQNLKPYRWLLQSDQLLRIYLDELPPAPANKFELGVLEMIAAKNPNAALEKALAMVPKLKASKRSHKFQTTLIQFVETVILYQFPHWSREEVEKVLQVNDVRQTRVFQEALEEGEQKGELKGELKGTKKTIEKVVRALLDLNRPMDEIVKVTDLTPAQIRKIKKKLQNG